jgi:hypothetical protein
VGLESDPLGRLAAKQAAAKNGGRPPLENVEPRTLEEATAVCRAWLHLPDPGILYVVWGSVAANLLDGDPVWLLVVGAPGSGKTEALMSLSRLPNVYEAGTLTEAALLSGSPKRERGPSATGGVLRQLDEFGIILCKDFGSVLSMHRDARANVLAALREVYDGGWTRLLGTDGGRTLHWEGKAGLVAGCTPVIDRHAAVMAAMGDRFILYRPQQVDRRTQARRAVSRGAAKEMRQQLTEATAGLFAGITLRGSRTLTEPETDYLIALSDFATRARSAIERDGFSRDIELISDPEMPARLAVALRGLVDGLDMIGLDRAEAWRVVTKAALDSVPALRLAVITVLHKSAEVSTTYVAVGSGYPTTTIRRTLEDLTALALVERQSNGQGKADTWRLTDEARTQLDAAQPFPKSREGHNGTFPEKSESAYKERLFGASSLLHPHTTDFSGTPSGGHEKATDNAGFPEPCLPLAMVRAEP